MNHKKISSSVIVLYSFFFYTMYAAALTTGPIDELADLPDHGWGRVSRVNNKTSYNMDVYFDKTIHDLLPEGTIAVLRSLDPKLGKEGKLIKAVQDKDKIIIKADGTNPKERAAQFEVRRRLAPDLSDWVGFSALAFDSQSLRINPDDNHHAEIATKDFQQDTHKQAHWKIKGKDLAECRLESRLSGILQNLVLEEEYALGKDEEKVEYAKDLWCCNYPITWRVVNATYGISKPPFEVTHGEYWGIRTWQTRGNWNFWKARHNYNDHQEKKSADVRNWIRDRINESGKLPIPANLNGIFGDPCYGFQKKLTYKVRVFNDIMIEGEVTEGQTRTVEIFNDSRVAARLQEVRTKFSQNLINAITADLKNWSAVNWGPNTIHTRIGDAFPGLEKFAQVELEINGSRQTFSGGDKQGLVIPLGGSPYKFGASDWEKQGGSLRCVAVGNKDEIWGIGNNRDLWRFNGKGGWDKQETNMPVDFVAVGSSGEVFVLHATDHSIWEKTKEGFKKLPSGNVKRLSVRTAKELWGIGMDDKMYKYSGDTGEWQQQKTFNTNGNARDVSVAADGSLWATNTNNQLFKSDDGGKNWVLIPADAWYVAARSSQEVFVIKQNMQIWKYDSGKWTQLPGAASHISCASGFNVTKIPAPRAKRTIETFTVRNQEGKPAEPTDGSKMAIEIVKLGMGGGIPAKSAGDFIKIPVFKNPRVAGFAQFQLPDINQGTLIKVTPLRSQGAAWLESTLPVPGKATVSFTARPGSSGDIQVIFGQEISNSFVWKVVIGGWRNTKAAIMKRYYEKGTPKDVFVCEVDRLQNPLAAAIPGSFTPYWVSINEGLILAGVGNVGENAFMAWRDPNPPEGVNTCGFGSHKSPVEYTEVQMLPAVDVQGTLRTYKRDKKTLKVAGGKSNLTWLTEMPFRVKDRGCAAATIEADGNAVLVLSSAQNLAKEHYSVVFGDEENKKLSLKKWLPTAKRYIERASLRYDTYPELMCKPGKKIRFWISYDAGTIAIGSGNIGSNVLLVIQDLNPHDNISHIGIGSLETNETVFSALEISSPVEFGIEKQLEGYKRANATFKYAGNMMIVTPFEYQFSQEDQSIKLTDIVNDATYYPGGTPQQGAFYDFMLSILEDGTPKLDWVNEPSNPKKLELERKVQKMTADAELARMTKELMDKDAAIQKSIKLAEAQRLRSEGDIKQQQADVKATTQKETAQAQGDVKRAEYNAALTTGDKISAAGSSIAAATSASGNPIIAGIGIGVGSAMIAGGLVKSALAEGKLREAAEQDAKGVYAAAATKVSAAQETADKQQQAALTEEQAAVIEAQLQRKALEREYQAAELEHQAKMLNGEVSAFRKIDAYVYTDQAPRTPLGSASIPDEAIENRKVLEERVINETMKKRPTTRESFEELLSVYKFGINLITHFYVIDKKAIKQQIFDTINALASAYTTLYGSDAEINESIHNDLINLLMAARNNPYLLNLNVADERKARDVWYANVIQLSRALLSKGKSGTIKLNATFGEYIWLTESASKEDVAEVSFEAYGLNDIFIGFADDTVPVRNTSREFYEVVLGAWDNSRHVVRLKSLDRSVHEVTKRQNKDAMLANLEFEEYSVKFEKGKITVTKGKGKKVVLEWQDPYPISGLRRLGIATWNSPITFRNITLNDKEVGQHDLNLDALSRDNPTEAIYQTLDLFAELESTVGSEELATTEDEDTVTLMDTLEEIIINAAENGFKKRRSMNSDQLVDFATALDYAQNWLAEDKNFKQAEFFLKTIVKELKKKNIDFELEEGDSSARQTGKKLAKTIAAKDAQRVTEEERAEEAVVEEVQQTTEEHVTKPEVVVDEQPNEEVVAAVAA